MKTHSHCWLVLPVLLVAVHQAVAVPGGIFAPAVSYGVGLNPIAVTTVDINGDGKVDLISANSSDDTLTVLTNNGSGAFGSNDTLYAGPNPLGVTAADVNEDGKPDLIVANYTDSPGTLTVLTNNGNGGFGFYATLTVGNGPVYVVAVDVHGNGKPDLISANNDEGTLTVLTNNGSGDYGTSATLPVGLNANSAPNSIAVADVNGDGKLDLVSANYNDNTLTIYTNDGAGGFVFSTTFTIDGVIVVPYSVAAADVNGDGKMDLIVANAGIGTLTILTNDGSGGFVLAATPTVGSSPTCVVAADVNGDGKVDLISTDASTNTLMVLTNNGSGGFGYNNTLTVGNTPLYVMAADLNGDGRLDLISANYNDNTLSVLLNGAAGGTPAPSLSISRTNLNTIVISWPLPADGFVLQQNTNLAPANWSAFSGTVNTNATTKSVTITAATGKLFFRLYHP